ncbi:malate dehydrogenase [Lipomyces starkeyi NRRL Y-11557]|uniref:Malate dehydrogenase n=1 Tax=Lipomyces starkeyi NRRL Y-11557 TaxID=675824 RepID=A0A1E3Q4H4_LIPST|nr:malate dehydrogenase [Lipomyces starkeyi NRRL Y-11557]
MAPKSSTRVPLSVKGPIDCPYEGKEMLNLPQFNRGTAFTAEERDLFNLVGNLPAALQTLQNQVDRAYDQYSSISTALGKNTFLMSLKVQNEVLYFKLLQDHLKEMFSIIYTPTESEAIEHYSRLFRRPEGCFLNINHPEYIERSLAAWGTEEDIDYIIVSDGEEILGIGDQGVGAIGISSAKAVLMTLCAGVHPSRCIPVALDVGTDNEQLLEDELYLGNRHNRVRGGRYDKFVDDFVQCVKKLYPRAVLHFEDFGLPNARRLLDTYRPRLACFNDDVQGTGAVTLAALSSAVRVAGIDFRDLRTVIFGAGTAGTGIADQLRDFLNTQGISKQQVIDHIWLVDKPGLLLKSMHDKLTSAQRPYAASDDRWKEIDTKSLSEIVKKVKPHVLIGCSTKPKAFNEAVLREMAKHVERPIVFPLSNPTRLHEATPAEIFKYTDGKALVATGSPFDPVDGKEIAENNNCFVYPGIGMGSILSRADRVTETMIAAVVKELASLAPSEKDPTGALLPDVADIRDISAKIATAVVLQALEEGTARVEEIEGIKVPRDRDHCLEWVKEQMWKPEYRPLRKV